jgi:hypothetical protein
MVFIYHIPIWSLYTIYLYGLYGIYGSSGSSDFLPLSAPLGSRFEQNLEATSLPFSLASLVLWSGYGTPVPSSPPPGPTPPPPSRTCPCRQELDIDEVITQTPSDVQSERALLFHGIMPSGISWSRCVLSAATIRIAVIRNLNFCGPKASLSRSSASSGLEMDQEGLETRLSDYHAPPRRGDKRDKIERVWEEEEEEAPPITRRMTASQVCGECCRKVKIIRKNRTHLSQNSTQLRREMASCAALILTDRVEHVTYPSNSNFGCKVATSPAMGSRAAALRSTTVRVPAIKASSSSIRHRASVLCGGAAGLLRPRRAQRNCRG